MSDIRKYVKLLESNYRQVNNEQPEDDCYLFSYDAELLYESSGISLDVLMENRIDWLRDNIMHKLEPVADKEGKSVEELFNWIIDQDPSTKKQYSQWLMKILVGKNAQSSLSDLEQAKNVLTKYEELKKSKALKPEHKDLNQFKSIDELSQAISDTEQNIKSEYDAIEQRARNESEIIHEDDVWIVAIPKTEYAAGYWGKESLWCTAAGFEGGRQEDRSNNMFEDYAPKSNLYTIVNKKKPKTIYQIHLDSKQFMNVNNSHVESLEDRKSILGQFPLLEQRMIAEIKNYENNRFDYAISFNKMFGYIPDGLIDENEIIDSPRKSYYYASNILDDRFEKGEDAISTDPILSVRYALYVIGDRFEKGEPTIVMDDDSYDTYMSFIRKRIPEIEKYLCKNIPKAINYHIEFMRGMRYVELEEELKETQPNQHSEVYFLNILFDDDISDKEKIETSKNINILGDMEIAETVGRRLLRYIRKYGINEVVEYLKPLYKEILIRSDYNVYTLNKRTINGIDAAYELLQDDDDVAEKLHELSDELGAQLVFDFTDPLRTNLIERAINKFKNIDYENLFNDNTIELTTFNDIIMIIHSIRMNMIGGDIENDAKKVLSDIRISVGEQVSKEDVTDTRLQFLLDHDEMK